MAINLEKRLFALEEELKALKSAYKVSGGMIKLYESVSPVFTISEQDVSYYTIVHFTPNYSSVDNLIVTSIYYEYRDEYRALSYNLSNSAYIIPQDSNYLVIATPAFEGEIQLKMISNIPGTFTRIS